MQAAGEVSELKMALPENDLFENMRKTIQLQGPATQAQEAAHSLCGEAKELSDRGVTANLFVSFCIAERCLV